MSLGGARLGLALFCLALGSSVSGCAAQATVGNDPGLPPPHAASSADLDLEAELDAIFSDPVLARALLAIRVESLRDGRTLYARNAGMRVVPASALKIVTTAVAAERLGWGHRFETRLEAAGEVADGVLRGDLIVTGGGDPSIAAQDLITAPLFVDWSEALEQAGIGRIDGRIIGDDAIFDDEALGAGWAWDYLAAGYAAPSGALSYNENVAVVRISPGETPGSPAIIELGPPGHELDMTNAVITTPADVPASIAFARLPGSSALRVSGSLPVGAGTLTRITSIDNPTRYFAEAFRLALHGRGITVTGGAWDIDDLGTPPSSLPPRRLIAHRQSLPLSALIGYAMKVSQNFYGDMLLKAVGAAAASREAPGSVQSGGRAVRETLAGWGLPADSLAMYDGSGLSRYNYASADLLVGVLKHVWHDERLRGPFVAALPVGGHDGTLASRMRNTTLDRRVQAKTGTISNVRSLAGYAESAAGEKLVPSAPTARAAPRTTAISSSTTTSRSTASITWGRTSTNTRSSSRRPMRRTPTRRSMGRSKT